VIYPVDSAIQPLNNRGQISTRETNTNGVFHWTETFPVDVSHPSNNWAQDYFSTEIWRELRKISPEFQKMK